MIELGKCQKIKLDQGFIYLGPSDTESSEGYLELNPHTSLTLHNRTGIEHLTQISGQASMVIFDQPKGRLVTLLPGNKLTIKPAGTWHIHCNPFEEICLQYWFFEGDITKIIDQIRTGAE